MKYIVKFDGQEEKVFNTPYDYKSFAKDGLCKYVIDGETGEVLYERKYFYVIFTKDKPPNIKNKIFTSYNSAYGWAKQYYPDYEWYISPLKEESEE